VNISFCEHYSSLSYEPILINGVSKQSPWFIDTPKLNFISVLTLWRAREAFKGHFFAHKECIGNDFKLKISCGSSLGTECLVTLASYTCRLEKLLMSSLFFIFIIFSYLLYLCSACDNSEAGCINVTECNGFYCVFMWV
jgi:hypothetical protein